MAKPVVGLSAALDRDVRLNPAYRLWNLAELPEAERKALWDLGVDPLLAHGLITADAGSGLPDKVVDRAGTDLLDELRCSAHFPIDAVERFLPLLLDDVLQVDLDGEFVGGPRAYLNLAGDPDEWPALDRLAGLSQDAVGYAERLGSFSVEHLTARLYCFFRIPLAPRWRHRYPDMDSVLEIVGHNNPRSSLTRHWTRYGESLSEDWISWRRKDEHPLRAAAFPYKLYISPAMEAIEDAMTVMVDALTESGAMAFKLGSDAPGLLRPDKAVVYLRDNVELERVARAVERALGGFPAHGVPFTAQLAEEGLISWGGDPEAGEEPVGAETESWRLSICRRLAENLVAAGRAGLTQGWPARFALARLALDGVDVTTFAPSGLEPPRQKRAALKPELVQA